MSKTSEFIGNYDNLDRADRAAFRQLAESLANEMTRRDWANDRVADLEKSLRALVEAVEAEIAKPREWAPLVEARRALR